MRWIPCLTAMLPAALALTLTGTQTHAAEPLEAWFETGLRFEPVKRWRVDTSAHLRLDEDLSRIQRVMPEVATSYRVVGPLRLGAGYRFIWERDNRGEFEPGHRVHVDAAVAVPLGPLQARYRLRGQRSWEWTRWGEREEEQVVRNQIRLSYRGSKRVRPLIWAEHFLDTYHLDDQPTNKWRFGLGAEVRAGNTEVEPFAMVELASRDEERVTTYILGASLVWEPFGQ